MHAHARNVVRYFWPKLFFVHVWPKHQIRLKLRQTPWPNWVRICVKLLQCLPSLRDSSVVSVKILHKPSTQFIGSQTFCLWVGFIIHHFIIDLNPKIMLLFSPLIFSNSFTLGLYIGGKFRQGSITLLLISGQGGLSFEAKTLPDEEK